MKKKIKLLLIMFISLIIIPLNVKAETYNTLDFQGALKDEGIEEKFKNYKPDDNAITIYMFRGKGCGFCRAYLEFMNSIADEYGKYFKMETYEVWNDSNNSTLMNDVSTYLGQVATGVPYIIIGDQVFAGYNEKYDESIKSKIKEVYDTKKSKRYDVFKEMEKSSDKKGITITDNALVWNFIFTLVSTIIIITYINLKFKELSSKIENKTPVEKKNNKNKK